MSETATTGVLAIVPYSYPDPAALSAALAELRAHYPTEVSQLQTGGRDIPATLEKLIRLGCKKVIALSVCQPLDKSLSQWLPGTLASLQQQYPEVAIHWATPKSGQPLAQLLSSLVSDPVNNKPVTGVPATLSNPGWQYPIRRRWHLLLCTGPRCQVRGAQRIRMAIGRWLKQQGIKEDDPERGVQLNGCSCLYPCNQGPLLVINPGDTWYANLTPEQVPELLDKHLLNGEITSEQLIETAPEEASLPC